MTTEDKVKSLQTESIEKDTVSPRAAPGGSVHVLKSERV